MRHLVLVAGRPSHGPGEHEFPAGAALLKRCLDHAPLDLRTTLLHEGRLPTVDDGAADAVVLYSDGGPSHPLRDGGAWSAFGRLAESGVGLGLLHYALEPPAATDGAAFEACIGGWYAAGISCNPMWEASIEVTSRHPIGRGVPAFRLHDEWYFGLVLAGDDGDGPRPNGGPAELRITPILTAVPSDDVRAGPYVYPPGPYPHIMAASGRPEVLMWAAERAGGGRSIGLGGGHFHRNWANEAFRRVVLNALAWVAGAEVPAGGVDSTFGPADAGDGAPKPAPTT